MSSYHYITYSYVLEGDPGQIASFLAALQTAAPKLNCTIDENAQTVTQQVPLESRYWSYYLTLSAYVKKLIDVNGYTFTDCELTRVSIKTVFI